MKKRYIVPVVALVVICVSAVYFFWASRQKNTEITDADLAAVNSGVQNLATVDSAKVNFNFDITSLPLEADSFISGNLSGDLSFNGTEAIPTTSLLTIDADLETSDGKINFQDLSLLNDAQQLYFKLQTLSSDIPGINNLGLNLDSIADRWFIFQADDTSLAALPMVDSQLTTFKNQSSKLENFDISKLQSVLIDSHLFKNISLVAEEKINEVDTTHYSFSDLDPKSTANLLAQTNEILENRDYTADELAQLEKELELFSLSGDIWIDTDKGLLQKISLTVNPVGANADNLELTFEINLSEINQAITIEDPVDADTFASFVSSINQFPTLTTDIPASETDLLVDEAELTNDTSLDAFDL